MGYLLHRGVELSEERGSIAKHHPLRPAYSLETRDPHISHALWGVHDHVTGCYSEVEVVNGWGASNRIVKLNWKVIYEDFLEVVPPDMKGQRLSLPWELCRASHPQSLEIACPLMLLHVWAYDIFSIVAPQGTLQHSDGRPLSFRSIDLFSSGQEASTRSRVATV
ncbi:serine/threonine-protein phosphatase 7 long form-like protein [Cucumis melo var. makuwa]|uniref:Serine/threonine-protein phosphatase 7 long form-like protein n=1 Tax=Cucumis melo var. makuwa TaxID=1194695 RepID=A0A5D3E172_CUCMM|nr:serine/threonine-protein phosphatase 7 long form-like protein [Cucumis melo var. makuwa]